MEKRGGFAEPFADAPKDFDFEDPERKARRGAFFVGEKYSDEAVAPPSFSRILVRGEAMNAKATARVLNVDLAGVDGVAGSGMVVGRDAIKELLFAKSAAATRRNPLKSSANLSAKQVYDASRSSRKGGDTGVMRSLVREFGEQVRLDAYYGFVNIWKYKMKRLVDSTIEMDRRRWAMFRALELGRTAFSVRVEDGNLIDGKTIFLGGRAITERRLLEIQVKLGATRQQVIGYSYRLPASVGGAAAADHEKREKDRRRKMVRGLDASDSDTPDEDASKNMLAVLMARAGGAEDVARVEEARRHDMAMLAAAEFNQSSSSATDTSSGAESVTLAGMRQPFALLATLYGEAEKLPSKGVGTFADPDSHVPFDHRVKNTHRGGPLSKRVDERTAQMRKLGIDGTPVVKKAKVVVAEPVADIFRDPDSGSEADAEGSATPRPVRRGGMTAPFDSPAEEGTPFFPTASVGGAADAGDDASNTPVAGNSPFRKGVAGFESAAETIRRADRMRERANAKADFIRAAPLHPAFINVVSDFRDEDRERNRLLREATAISKAMGNVVTVEEVLMLQRDAAARIAQELTAKDDNEIARLRSEAAAAEGSAAVADTDGDGSLGSTKDVASSAAAAAEAKSGAQLSKSTRMRARKEAEMTEKRKLLTSSMKIIHELLDDLATKRHKMQEEAQKLLTSGDHLLSVPGGALAANPPPLLPPSAHHESRFVTAPDGRVGVAASFNVTFDADKGLPSTHPLRYLNLSGTMLCASSPWDSLSLKADDAHAAAGDVTAVHELAALLSHPNCGLEALNISKNRLIGGDAAEMLLAALDASPRLVSLNVHGTVCGAAVACGFAAKALALTRVHGRSVFTDERLGLAPYTGPVPYALRIEKEEAELQAKRDRAARVSLQRSGSPLLDSTANSMPAAPEDARSGTAASRRWMQKRAVRLAPDDRANNAMRWTPEASATLRAAAWAYMRPYLAYTLVRELPAHFATTLTTDAATAIMRRFTRGASEPEERHAVALAMRDGPLKAGSVVYRLPSLSVILGGLFAGPPVPAKRLRLAADDRRGRGAAAFAFAEPGKAGRPPSLGSFGPLGAMRKSSRGAPGFSAPRENGFSPPPTPAAHSPPRSREGRSLSPRSLGAGDVTCAATADDAWEGKGPLPRATTPLPRSPSRDGEASPARRVNRAIEAADEAARQRVEQVKKRAEENLAALEAALAAQPPEIVSENLKQRVMGLAKLNLNGTRLGDVGALTIAVTIAASERAADAASGRARAIRNATLAVAAARDGRPLTVTEPSATALHRGDTKHNAVVAPRGGPLIDVYGVDDAAASLLHLDEFSSAPRLCSLKLRSNDITPLGLRSLFRGVRVSTSLRVLDVSNNPLGAAGAHVLAQALGGGSGASACPLSSLRADGCQLSDGGTDFRGVIAVFDALGSNRVLESLSLRANRLVAQGFAFLAPSVMYPVPDAIGRAIERNVTLRELDVSGNNFGTHGARIVLNGIARAPHVTRHAALIADTLTQWLDAMLSALHTRAPAGASRVARALRASRNAGAVVGGHALAASLAGSTASIESEGSLLSPSLALSMGSLAPLGDLAGIGYAKEFVPQLPAAIALRAEAPTAARARQVANAVYKALAASAALAHGPPKNIAQIALGGRQAPVAVRAATVLDFLFPAATGMEPPASGMDIVDAADASRVDPGPEGGNVSVLEMEMAGDGRRPLSAASSFPSTLEDALAPLYDPRDRARGRRALTHAASLVASATGAASEGRGPVADVVAAGWLQQHRASLLAAHERAVVGVREILDASILHGVPVVELMKAWGEEWGCTSKQTLEYYAGEWGATLEQAMAWLGVGPGGHAVPPEPVLPPKMTGYDPVTGEPIEVPIDARSLVLNPAAPQSHAGADGEYDVDALPPPAPRRRSVYDRNGKLVGYEIVPPEESIAETAASSTAAASGEISLILAAGIGGSARSAVAFTVPATDDLSGFRSLGAPGGSASAAAALAAANAASQPLGLAIAVDDDAPLDVSGAEARDGDDAALYADADAALPFPDGAFATDPDRGLDRETRSIESLGSGFISLADSAAPRAQGLSPNGRANDARAAGAVAGASDAALANSALVVSVSRLLSTTASGTGGVAGALAFLSATEPPEWDARGVGTQPAVRLPREVVAAAAAANPALAAAAAEFKPATLPAKPRRPPPDIFKVVGDLMPRGHAPELILENTAHKRMIANPRPAPVPVKPAKAAGADAKQHSPGPKGKSKLAMRAGSPSETESRGLLQMTATSVAGSIVDGNSAKSAVSSSPSATSALSALIAAPEVVPMPEPSAPPTAEAAAPSAVSPTMPMPSAPTTVEVTTPIAVSPAMPAPSAPTAAGATALPTAGSSEPTDKSAAAVSDAAPTVPAAPVTPAADKSSKRAVVFDASSSSATSSMPMEDSASASADPGSSVSPAPTASALQRSLSPQRAKSKRGMATAKERSADALPIPRVVTTGTPYASIGVSSIAISHLARHLFRVTASIAVAEGLPEPAPPIGLGNATSDIVETDYTIVRSSLPGGEIAIPRLDFTRLRRNALPPAKVVIEAPSIADVNVANFIKLIEETRTPTDNVSGKPPRGGYAGVSPLNAFCNSRGVGVDDFLEIVRGRERERGTRPNSPVRALSANASPGESDAEGGDEVKERPLSTIEKYERLLSRNVVIDSPETVKALEASYDKQRVGDVAAMSPPHFSIATPDVIHAFEVRADPDFTGHVNAPERRGEQGAEIAAARNRAIESLALEEARVALALLSEAPSSHAPPALPEPRGRLQRDASLLGSELAEAPILPAVSEEVTRDAAVVTAEASVPSLDSASLLDVSQMSDDFGLAADGGGDGDFAADDAPPDDFYEMQLQTQSHHAAFYGDEADDGDKKADGGRALGPHVSASRAVPTRHGLTSSAVFALQQLATQPLVTSSGAIAGAEALAMRTLLDEREHAAMSGAQAIAHLGSRVAGAIKSSELRLKESQDNRDAVKALKADLRREGKLPPPHSSPVRERKGRATGEVPRPPPEIIAATIASPGSMAIAESALRAGAASQASGVVVVTTQGALAASTAIAAAAGGSAWTYVTPSGDVLGPTMTFEDASEQQQAARPRGRTRHHGGGHTSSSPRTSPSPRGASVDSAAATAVARPRPSAPPPPWAETAPLDAHSASSSSSFFVAPASASRSSSPPPSRPRASVSPVPPSGSAFSSQSWGAEGDSHSESDGGMGASPARPALHIGSVPLEPRTAVGILSALGHDPTAASAAVKNLLSADESAAVQARKDAAQLRRRAERKSKIIAGDRFAIADTKKKKGDVDDAPPKPTPALDYYGTAEGYRGATASIAPQLKPSTFSRAAAEASLGLQTGVDMAATLAAARDDPLKGAGVRAPTPPPPSAGVVALAAEVGVLGFVASAVVTDPRDRRSPSPPPTLDRSSLSRDGSSTALTVPATARAAGVKTSKERSVVNVGADGSIELETVPVSSVVIGDGPRAVIAARGNLVAAHVLAGEAGGVDAKRFASAIGAPAEAVAVASLVSGSSAPLSVALTVSELGATLAPAPPRALIKGPGESRIRRQVRRQRATDGTHGPVDYCDSTVPPFPLLRFPSDDDGRPPRCSHTRGLFPRHSPR